MVTILNIEMKTTSTGKPYKSAKIDEQVMGKDRFNIFGFHTRYEDVVAGRSFEATDFEKDGEYIKLRDPDQGIKGRTSGAPRRGPDPVAIAQAQEHKADLIRGAQDNKDLAIRLSGSMNHAVNVVTTFYKDDALEPDKVKTKIINWRNWFLDNWDLPKDDINPDEIPF
jgi:hypothetical protein